MVKNTYSQSHAKRMAFRSSEAPRTNFVDREVVLHGGRVSDVFTVDGYVLVHGMFMRITEAVTNSACNMAWIYDPDDGGVQTDMGANVAIANKAIGITYYLELDGTAIVEVAANAVTTGVMNNITTTGRGMIVPPGGIDVKLSASKAMLAGKSPKLKAVFTGILADIVTKPSEFPGLGIPFTNIETAFDKRIPTKTKWGMLPVYNYIKNGCGELVKVFADYITENNGGEIHTNSKVQKIIIENNQAKGVQLENGETINADLIVASGGMFNTFFNLVGKEYLPEELIKQIETKRLMESVFMVHLGIDFDPSKFQRAALCYYYLTYDIEDSIGKMREGIYHEGKEGFLIYIPSMHSPDMAPTGKHAVTIYTVCPHELKEGTWEEKREEMADKLIMEAEKIIPGLYEGSEVKVVMTPDDFKKRINVVRHSFGGTAPVMEEQNPAHRTPIQGLWYIGAYSESGGGVAGASLGARNVAKKILKES